MDSCEQFFNEHKSYLEKETRCNASYGRGFIIFRKDADILVQFHMADMPLTDEALGFILHVTNAIKAGIIRT